MNKIKLTFCVLVTFLLTACASGPTSLPFKKNSQGETEVGSSMRSYVGDVIYSKFDISEQYEGFVTGTFGYGLFEDIKMVESPAMRMVVNGKDGALVRSASMTQGFYPDIPTVPFYLIDENSDSMFESYFYAGNKGKIKTPITVEWERSSRSKGYKRELIYQGRSGDNVKLLYREYIDDFARPAYNQEVQYDFSKSNILQFRGLSISIQEADNEFLIYTIESGSL